MATTNLFSDPAFRDGAFTSNDPRVRAYAMQKTMRSMDLGAELGAETYVFWGGREGVETNAAKDARVPHSAGFARRSTSCARTTCRRGTTSSLRWSPSPTSRAATSSCRRSATRWRSFKRLHYPDMVGVNPEVAHDTIAGLGLHARRRAGDRCGQALSHRSQRAEAGTLRSGSSLRQRGHQGLVLPRQAARRFEVLRHEALRQPCLSH